MNKKYEYNGNIYCEDDLSEEIYNYGGDLDDLFSDLLRNKDIEETTYYSAKGACSSDEYYEDYKELIKEEYEKALKEMNDAFYGITFLNSQTRRFDDNLNLLRELVNEHFEEKQETNYEHYKDEIIEGWMLDLALVDGKLKRCSRVDCNECEFNPGANKGCEQRLIEWLKQPYKKLPYKLSQFEFDLLNAHKDSGMQKCISNYRPLLELHEKGYFKDVDTSTPIHEILDNCKVV